MAGPTYMGSADPTTSAEYSNYYPAWLDNLADDVLSFRLYPGERDFDASGVTEDLRRWLIMEQRVGFTLDERRR